MLIELNKLIAGLVEQESRMHCLKNVTLNHECVTFQTSNFKPFKLFKHIKRNNKHEKRWHSFSYSSARYL